MKDYVVQTSPSSTIIWITFCSNLQQKQKFIKSRAGDLKIAFYVVIPAFTPQGAEHWLLAKRQNAGILDAGPAGGALPFDIFAAAFTWSTPGVNIAGGWIQEYLYYDGHDMNISKRGYLMGIREALTRGTFTAVQGPAYWYEFDMMGQILADRKLPRGFWMRLMNPSKP